MNTVVENELFLSTEYIQKHSLIPTENICVKGGSLICGCLTELLSRFQRNGDDASCAERWYVSDVGHCEEAKLTKVLQNSEKENKRLLIILLLDHIEENDTIERYAEMELIAVSDRLKKIRELIKTYASVQIKLLLCDRLIGAEFDGLNLKDQPDCDNTVIISQNDIRTHISALYTPDLINAVFTVSKQGKDHNVYNASSFAFSRFELKSALYSLLSTQGVTVKTENDRQSNASFSALSYGKLSSLGYEPVCDFQEALRYTLSERKGYDLFSPFIRSQYDGKLSALRSLQLSMLKELDRICRKHQIRYFLSGGSMLGAVRHRGYIPWDDDIDVSFLREDYIRFKAVVRDELSSEFLYQNYENHNGYHYFFDRISAKNTYFATKYSDGYEMPKGISVDIFVFDNAPENAYRFWKHLMNKRMIMNVRWKNAARRDKAYLLSKLLLPILRLKSMDSYSSSYDRAIRKYEKKETGFVLPPATDHNYKGSMPKKWFSKVIPAQFEGIETFIPAGYDNYLRIWYGDDYMTLLPLSKRQSYHDYYRLDAGANEFDKTIHFSDRGELI